MPHTLCITDIMDGAMLTKKPLLLIVLDGWGYADASSINAITQANIPVWNKLWATCPHTLISASGLDVGLPPGQMGNSEVGHMTLGAGRVIFQDLTRITKAISDQSFFKNATLVKALEAAKQNHKTVHILGLLSPGGVHSHEDHILAMVEMAKQHKIQDIYVHAFLDGRDVPPKSALFSLAKIEPYIASIIGRFYAMDRDKRIERTQAAIDLLVHGKAAFTANDAAQGIELAYARGETDEFVQPTQIKPVTIKPGDCVIFMNFRSDRARQLSHALVQSIPELSDKLITLTEYDATLPACVVFPTQKTTDTFSDVIAQQNLTQLHIAETEKYAHVTFFFNAGRETAVAGESRTLIPSPKVNTYDQQPAMSAQLITNELVVAIEQKQFDVIICNFANADMVGHTGIMPATITAIETIDACLGRIFEAINKFGGQAVITSDHGNAEIMWDEKSKQPHTAHTTNLVPIIYMGPKKLHFKTDQIYGLQDVAPTLLELLQIKKPTAMTGVSMISAD
jgi:2,3-bisphosphoglycerate-independent phosphoglycerate mutase